MLPNEPRWCYVIRNGSRDVGQRPARSDHPSSTFLEQLLGLTITAARSWKLWPVWVSEMVTCKKTAQKLLQNNYSKTTLKLLQKNYSKNTRKTTRCKTTTQQLFQNYSKTTLKLLKTTLKLLKNYSVSKTSLKLLQNDCKTIIPKLLQICSKTTQNYSKTTLKLLGQKHVF